MLPQHAMLHGMPGCVARSLRAWTVSILPHGLACGVTVLWLADLPLQRPREPFTWNVSLIMSQSEPPKSSSTTPSPPPSRAQAGRPPLAQSEATTVSQTVRTVPPVQVKTQPFPTEQAMAPHLQATNGRASLVDWPTPPTGIVKADYGWLARELWDRVERLKRFPWLARLHGREGKVVIPAVIDEKGRLVHQEIEESSGYEALDQDALALRNHVCPLTLRHSLGEPQVAVHVPIHYRIEL